MEFFNKINFISFNNVKSKNRQKANNINFKGSGSKGFELGLETAMKAKINIDSAYAKPISYEEKIKILKEKGLKEEDFQLFLMENDEEFKKMIEYYSVGVTLDDIKEIYSGSWTQNDIRKAAELSKHNIPYSFSRNIAQNNKIPKERLELLKKIKFDYNDKRENFPIDEYKLENILEDDKKFEKFIISYKKGIEANVALYCARLEDDEFEKLNQKLEEEKELNQTTTAAYYLNEFSDDEISQIKNISKAQNKNANNYNLWINACKKRSLEENKKLIELGVDDECLQKYINIDEETLKEAIKKAEEEKISQLTSITIYEETTSEEERKRAIELSKNKNVGNLMAIQLAGYDTKVSDEILKYLDMGLDSNSSIILANLEKDDNFKQELIGLLKYFNHVHEAKTFLEMNLSGENYEKALGLIQKGANIYFVDACLKSEKINKKVTEIINSGSCDSLEGIYGGFEDEVIKNLEYIGLGVPATHVQMFSCRANQEQIELLKSGVDFNSIEELIDYENEGFDATRIKEYLKKGISFETAKKLNEKKGLTRLPEETIINNIYPKLSERKILQLSKIEKEKGKDWVSEETKKEIVDFVRELKNSDNLEYLAEEGLLNKKALTNYKEFIKRGITSRHSDNAVLLSQIDFKDSNQFDRATELLKIEVPFSKILTSMLDDNSFIEAIKTSQNSSIQDNNLPLKKTITELFKNGFSNSEILLVADNYRNRDKSKIDELKKYIDKGHSIEDADNIANYKSTKTDEDESKEILSELILKGCSYEYLEEILDNTDKKNRLNSLISNGHDAKVAEKVVYLDAKLENKKLIKKIEDFTYANINDKLKEHSKNPTLYPFIDELYDFNRYSPEKFKKIMKSNVSVEDVETSGKIFVKSPLKLAMKRPNLYLKNIPIEDTEKINGQYPIIEGKKLEEYQNRMLEFFKNNLTQISKVLKFIDVDTFNQLMDKRTSSFSEILTTLDKIDEKHGKLISQIIKCRKSDGKLLSSKEKIDLSKIILYHQIGYLDTKYIEDIVQSGLVNIDELNKIIFEKLVENIGLSKEDVDKYPDKFDFDKEYMFLLLRTKQSGEFMVLKECLEDSEKKEATINELEEALKNPEELAHNGLSETGCKKLIDLLKRSEQMSEKKIFKEYMEISPFASVEISAQDIAKIAVLNDFKTYIQDKKNKIGQVNEKTKKKFKKNNLDYDKWLNYAKTSTITLDDRKYNIKLWDRYPQKDLFMGNRTSCCTAIIDGGNGNATPIYLANTAFNVVELTDENGDIIAMSRIFAGNVNKKPSMIIENIEVNNAFLKSRTKDDLTEIRNSMFEYIKNFANEISNNQEMEIYFSKNYTHVPMDDYVAKEEVIDFIGSISSEKIYINSKPGWVAPKELKDEACSLYKIV